MWPVLLAFGLRFSLTASGSDLLFLQVYWHFIRISSFVRHRFWSSACSALGFCPFLGDSWSLVTYSVSKPRIGDRRLPASVPRPWLAAPRGGWALPRGPRGRRCRLSSHHVPSSHTGAPVCSSDAGFPPHVQSGRASSRSECTRTASSGEPRPSAPGWLTDDSSSDSPLDPAGPVACSYRLAWVSLV